MPSDTRKTKGLLAAFALRRFFQAEASPMPIGYTDSQLEIVMTHAAVLDRSDRHAFLADVATALDGQALGDGIVSRVCREVQRRILKAA
jgi:hypothetical protein